MSVKGPAVVPEEYPPPFDEHELIAAPTDPEDERIEVGVAIVGGGPAGLACANKLLDLLADEPELMEKLGEVPVAVIEKGKVCGAHTLSGANMVPSAMRELFPDLDPSDWPFAYQEVTKDAVYLLTKSSAAAAEADAAELPQPRQLRDLGREAVALPRRAGGGEGRLHPHRDGRRQAPGRGPDRARDPLRRPRARQGRRAAGQLRARLRRDREGDRARRGHARPPDSGGARLLRPPRHPPGALGARREGGLGGQQAARPGDPHDGLAASQAGEVERVRRQLHLPDGRGQALRSGW